MSLLETTVRSALETRVEPVTFSMLLLLLVLEVVILKIVPLRALCAEVSVLVAFLISTLPALELTNVPAWPSTVLP